MAKIQGVFQPGGRVDFRNEGNGAELTTDLPAAHGGEGKHFSPGEMLLAALAGCSMLTMGAMAKARGKSLDGTRIEVDGQWASGPERLVHVTLTVAFPDFVDAGDRPKYLAAIKVCPVHNSIDKNIVVEVVSN